jgi:hypothetical protein
MHKKIKIKEHFDFLIHEPERLASKPTASTLAAQIHPRDTP